MGKVHAGPVLSKTWNGHMNYNQFNRRMFRLLIASLILLFILTPFKTSGYEIANYSYVDFYRTPYFFMNFSGEYEKDSSNIENCQVIPTSTLVSQDQYLHLDYIEFYINSVNNSNNTFYVSLYESEFSTISSYKDTFIHIVSSNLTTYSSGTHTLQFNVDTNITKNFFSFCIRENIDNGLIQFGYGGHAVDRIGNQGIIARKIIENDIQYMDDYYAYNDISYSIYGNAYTLTITPIPVIINNSNGTIVSNYSNNYTGGVNTTGWGNYSSQVIGSMNSTIYSIFQIVDYPFLGLRSGIQSINSSLNNSTYNLSMSFLVVVVPPIINAIPNKIKTIITLYLIFLVILIILGRE